MPDLLVNLLKLPPREDTPAREFTVRHAQPWELTLLRTFVTENFSQSWADEISVGFARQPISVYVATVERKLVGFAAYECTRRAFFGPTGVAPDARGKNIGKALLLAPSGACERWATSTPSSATRVRCTFIRRRSVRLLFPTASPAFTSTR